DHVLDADLRGTIGPEAGEDVSQADLIALGRRRLERLPGVPEELVLQFVERVVIVEQAEVGPVGAGTQLIEQLAGNLQVARESLADAPAARVKVAVIDAV